MRDVSEKSARAVAVFNGSLVIGDHDSITLFGVSAQNGLKDYSRKISELLLQNSSITDEAIINVLREIENFEKKTQKPAIPIFGKAIRNNLFRKECEKIISYIDDVSTFFRLQQAQIIKEIKLLEKLDVKVLECGEELKKCIDIGNTILKGREHHRENLIITNSTEMETWYARLEKRVNDLSVSRTISVQSRAQIQLLRENNLLLLDRISSSISNIFPIWQNKISIMLGIDLLQSRLELQERVNDATDRHIQKTTRQFGKKAMDVEKDFVDITGIFNVNRSLKNALNELAILENRHEQLRKQLSLVSE